MSGVGAQDQSAEFRPETAVGSQSDAFTLFQSLNNRGLAVAGEIAIRQRQDRLLSRLAGLAGTFAKLQAGGRNGGNHPSCSGGAAGLWRSPLSRWSLPLRFLVRAPLPQCA